jgi:hypothetical protein
LARGSCTFQSFEHELDALHIDVGKAVLKADDDVVGRIERFLREVSGDFQNEFSIVFVVLQPLDKSFRDLNYRADGDVAAEHADRFHEFGVADPFRRSTERLI